MAHASDEVRETLENRKTVFMGLGFALVWLLIVGAVSYFWALSGGGEAEGTGAAAPAGQQAH